MSAIQELGAFVSPRHVAIFVQPPTPDGGIAFVPLLLTQVNIPQPGRAALNLSETEVYERRWSITRNPVERIVAQNRIREPDSLTITGMLSANPIFSLLQNVGIARLDKRELLKLKTILLNELAFIVTPERPYANMSCVFFQETYDEDTGNGVRLTMRFQEMRIAVPGIASAAFDIALQELGIGAASAASLGPTTPQGVTDLGGLG